MLFAGELEITTDEDKHTAVSARRLTIDGGDGVMALLERERSEFSDDILRSHNLLTFEGKHGTFLVEISEGGTIGVEGGVVVLHECLC